MKHLERKNKVPIHGRGLDHPMSLGEAQNWVIDKGRVGWIVPNNIIVIDIDNKDHPKSASVLEKNIIYKRY